DRQLDWVQNQEFTLRYLQQPYKLGSSHAARVMAPYIQGVYGGEAGLGKAINEYRKALTKARHAITKAMENYQATEEKNRHKFP
ncbi:MAG: hypothetical protein ACRDQ5_04850, partial [Sciscionella sp.]